MGDEKADIGAPSDRGVSISGWAGNSDEALRLSTSDSQNCFGSNIGSATDHALFIRLIATFQRA